MQAPLKFKNNKMRGKTFLMKIFHKLEGWTTLAGFKGFLKNKAKNLLRAEGFGQTIAAVAVYSLYLIITVGQFLGLLLLILSIIGNMAGSTTPMLATLINSNLTTLEKIKTITGFTNNIVITNKEQDGNKIECSNIKTYWSPDLNTYIQDNKIRLKEGKTAGAIILKNPVSSFLGFEIKFKSSLLSGINTILSFRNSDGNLKYAIGDGDFRAIRYSYTDKTGVIRVREVSKLPVRINNEKEIGFKLSTIEKAQSTLASGVISYYDAYGQLHNWDLEDINIPNPKQLYLNIGFGLNAGLEPDNKSAYLELLSCSIIQTDPSKLLNI